MKNIYKQFRIYPFKGKKPKTPDKSCWYDVVIFNDVGTLRKNIVDKKCSLCKETLGGSSDCCGLTHGHLLRQTVDDYGNVINKKGIKGSVGTIFYAKDWCSNEIITHEIFHATLYLTQMFTNQINFYSPMFTKQDENMAQMMGNMCHWFFKEYDK